jgi:hypothetical protein
MWTALRSTHGVGMKHNHNSRSTHDRRPPYDGAPAPTKRRSNRAAHRAELPGLAGFALALALGGLSACGGGKASEPEPAASSDGMSPAASAPAAASSDGMAPVASAPAATSASAQWVCDLIPTARLQAAFGHTYASGESVHHDMPEPLPGMDQCVWSNTDEGAAIFSLTVTSGEQAVENYALMKEYATDSVPLTIGDDSYRVLSTISVLDGDMVYDLNAVGAQKQETFDAMAVLAEELAAR